MHTIQERLSLPEPSLLADDLCDFIRRIVQKEEKNGCVIGNSGGVDSALVAAMAVRALGKEHVHLFFLPERDTHKNSRRDAILVAKNLGLKMRTINITSILRKLGVYRLEPLLYFFPRSVVERSLREKRKEINDKEGSAFLQMQRGGNDPKLLRDIAYCCIKNRVRMSILYLHAELKNCLVLGTTNQSEKMLGLYAKYGDGACDLAPLDGLYKTQVFDLARYMGVPAGIIDKPPTGDLCPGSDDEEVLNLGYAQIDRILAGLELGLPDDTIARDGVSQSDLDYLRNLISASESKRRNFYTPNIV